MRNIIFTGGGSGGHIYPGLAVVDEFRKKMDLSNSDSHQICIYWMGADKGIDRDIVEKSGSIDKFIGISSGKLRRYLSWKNITDIFSIIKGLIKSFFVLKKLKPILVFSKGGFVSVPPCLAAKLLHIPVFTHECDYSPGLATRINSKAATKILLSFEKTKSFFSKEMQSKLIVTGDPVRPVFYNTDKKHGLNFLGLNPGLKKSSKPILLVLGGSLGSVQINTLIKDNLTWLCEHFYVIHQTGSQWIEQLIMLKSEYYRPYPFIYNELPDVMAAADVVLSRAGSNFLWECAITSKPLVLIPLPSNSSRGDQIENADFFRKNNSALVLGGRDTPPADSENLQNALTVMLDETKRNDFSNAINKLTIGRKPVEYIADIILKEVKEEL